MHATTRLLVRGLLGVLVVASPSAAEERAMADLVATGTYWYAMTPEGGEPAGYARLDVRRAQDGGLDFRWTLKIASDGGNYEEERRLVLDRALAIRESEMRAFGNLVCSGRYVGETWRVTTIEQGQPVEGDADAPPAGALTGLAFPIAAAVPREPGGVLERPELDEANGLRPRGTVRYVWQEVSDRTWDGRPLRVHLVVAEKADGRRLRVQVDEQGRVVEVDWGGGMRMLLSSESTEALYEARPPVLEVLEAGERLVLEGDLESFSPAAVLTHFLDAEKMARFWAPEAQIEAKVGGAYRLSWPGPGWTLDGEVLAYEPGAHLAFRWRWAHRPEAPDQRVDLEVRAREGGGSRIRLVQGPYRETEEDAAEREGHQRGWEATFSSLRALR